MSSENTLEFLLERLAAVAPDVDQNSTTFQAEFTSPVSSYFGIGQPKSDVLAIVRARLSEEFPDIEDSALSDAVGRIAALIFQTLDLENEAAKSRRSLNDRRLLSGSDLEDHRSSFFVDPENGRFASGTMRAYFPTPRNLTVDGVTRITIASSGDAPERIYRPSSFVTITAASMRNQIDGTRYYVDIPVVATEPGTIYDLEVGQARGATGVVGASSITNLTRIEGGADADDPTSYLARIQNSNRNRSAASFGGLEYLLGTLGLSAYYLSRAGDELMLRDRIYGPSFISGVLGGYKRDYSNSSTSLTQGEFVSLGVAYDLWITSEGGTQQETTTVRVSNCRDEGLLLVSGDIGYIEHDGNPATPVQVDPTSSAPLASNEYVFVTRALSLGLVVNDPSIYRQPFVRHTWSAFPIEIGDVIERESWVDTLTGIRSRGIVRSLGNGILTNGQKTVVEWDTTDTAINIDVDRFRWQAVRSNADWTDSSRGKYAASILPHTSVPCFALPLIRRRAIGANGDVITVGNYPALTKPGVETPELVNFAYVPRTRNLIEQETPLPLAWLSRIELMDAINGQPKSSGQRAYAYPAHPLFVEFLEARHSADATAGSTPVRVRFHLTGPQAMAPSPACSIGIDGIDFDVDPSVPSGYTPVGSGVSYEAASPGNPVVGKDSWKRYGPYRPLYWGSTTYAATPLDATLAETDRLVLGTPGIAESNLTDFIGQIVYDEDGPRTPRAGDWAFLIPDTFVDAVISDTAGWPDPYPYAPNYTDLSEQEWFKVARAFPIQSIEAGGDAIIVAAPDIPSNETGRLFIVQGTSRAAQIAQGRTAEGTYNFDVFCARLDHTSSDPQDVEHPPFNTPAQFDPLELYAHGFFLYSSRPGTFMSADDDVSLLLPTGYLNDGEEVDGRTLQLYGPTGSRLTDIQETLDDPSVRPMTNTGLVRQMPPARVVIAFHYEAEDLEAEQAASVVVAAFAEAQVSKALDLSDLVDALRDAGATYVSTGRAFVMVQDHLRDFRRNASRGTTQLDDIGDLIPDAILCRQIDTTLRAQAKANNQDFVDENPSNWIGEFVYRFGDYQED